ncbi:putative tyrosinase-like protein tyr-3 isoform X2 [Ruditapes philippinarum]|uniref:putative tyrosinase-like protein tyr-3 isoform X2 n=1 Tax=Ruditapes philippinarum TaxID=129788 RepID=UPI00295B9370|nr:putative tyrosinase-like protein tyr-3 isoform X2 [Ruditapes philippinarum]
MVFYLAHLLVALIVCNYTQAFQFTVNLPDSAQTKIEECIQKSRNSPVIPWQAEMACGHEYYANLGANNLTEEDWAVFETATEEGFGHTPPSFGISARREIRTLSKKEWEIVTDVFRKLYDKGVLQSFGRLHGNAILNVHRGAAFLPWHRVFLAHFEQEMKKINPSVSLPYWDYTIDYDIPQPYDTVMWTPCFFGDNNDTVSTSSFQFLYGAHGAVIARHIAEDCSSSRFINKTDMDRLKGFCRFEDITTGANTTKEKMVHNLEHLHNGVHNYIGGDMGVVQNSAYDPIFWFHHAFIDYIWESYREHQTANCGDIDIESDYRKENDTGRKGILKQGYNDTLFGYHHLKNKDGLWRNWTKVFFNYETQPACGGKCTGEYLYCDDKKRCLSRTTDACKEKSTREKRESEESLVPQISCMSGTKFSGLKGDGRTIDTSKEESAAILKNIRQDILKNIRQEPETEEDRDPSPERFGFVVIGICVGVACTIAVFLIVRLWRNRNKLPTYHQPNIPLTQET